jgi:Skp family chaperone for outer membrane proteins
MKSPHQILIPSICLAIIAWFAPVAPAQDRAETKIGTLDFALVFQGYWETKQVLSALQIKRQQHEAVIEEKNQALRKLRGELDKIQAQLADPVVGEQRKVELSREGNEKVALGRKIEGERQEYIQLAENDMRAFDNRKRREIYDKIRRVIEIKAREHQLTVVLDISGLTANDMPAVLYYDKRTEITDEVLKALNANAPVTPPSSAPTVTPAPTSTTPAPEKAPEKTPEKAPETPKAP